MTTATAMLTEAGCQSRQQRLQEILTRRNAHAVAISDPHEIYYFTGALLPTMPFALPGFVWFAKSGPSWGVIPQGVEARAISEVLTYEWSQFGTVSPDLVRQLALQVEQRLKGVRAVRVAYQADSLPKAVADGMARTAGVAEWIAIDDDIRAMQMRKDPDEIAAIRHCIQVNLAGYTAARTAIRQGVTELEVLAAGQCGAMLAAGESVYHTGDYRCGAYNGPARKRPIERGEIYIIDAQTRCNGYWSDLSRAFLVGDEPTPLQQSIFDHIAAVQRQVPDLLKPGTDGRAVWQTLDRLIREHPALSSTGLIHHGGHAIGLRPHEMPDLNRDRGGVLEVGNVLSVEPGGYTDAARYGVRIENTYLITAAGAENLSEYPTQLVG